MFKEFPDAVIFPCQFVMKVVPLTIKLAVPVKLPFGSTCSVLWVTVTLVPDELVIEPLTTPFASIASVRVPSTG